MKDFYGQKMVSKQNGKRHDLFWLSPICPFLPSFPLLPGYLGIPLLLVELYIIKKKKKKIVTQGKYLLHLIREETK